MPRPATTPSPEPAWLLAAVEPEDLDTVEAAYKAPVYYETKRGLAPSGARALYWRPAA